MKKLIIFLTALILVTQSFAQSDVKIDRTDFIKNAVMQLSNSDKSKIKKNLRYGDFYFKQKTKGGYLEALKYYENAYKYNPNNLALNYKIGICYLKSLFKGRALGYLQKVIDSAADFTPDLYYFYAQALQYNYKFDQAIKYYQKFQQTGLYQKDNYYNFFTDKHIIECRNGRRLVKDSLPIGLVNMSSLNSPYDDYGPIITADGSKIYFTSRRPNEYQLKDVDGQYYEDIYYSELTNGHWQAAQSAGYPLNTPTHDAVVGLSYDGQTIIIYRDEDLYVSHLQGKTWTKPQKLPKPINSNEVESSAALSIDGNTIYFVRGKTSDALTSNGDIYYSVRASNGHWSTPVRLPDNVNTPYDEDGLFLHPDGRTLYFSSKGHNTMGGYDVFKTVHQDDGSWSDPVNLGYPLNTPDDDIYFVLSGNAKIGYISAVREDTKGFTDIYQVHFFTAAPYLSGEEKLIADLAQPQKETSFEPPVKITLVKGQVVDENGKPVEAEIEIIDNETGKVVYRVKTNSATGQYMVSLPSGKNYAMVIRKEGYLFRSENFDLVEENQYHEVQKKVVLTDLSKKGKTELRNIFFDYNKATLKPESYPELNRLVEFLKNHPDIKIEISGHTDTLGTFEYNMQLSERRAKAVYDYLVSKGISPGRLKTKGYGPLHPIASNKTAEGRARNRRVEVKIISTK